jgi:hypothetical protein
MWRLRHRSAMNPLSDSAPRCHALPTRRGVKPRDIRGGVPEGGSNDRPGEASMDGGRGGLDEIRDFVRAIYERHRGETTGAVADYIPELGRVDADAFGVAVATVAGEVVAVGDSDKPFTIQSVANALT